MIQVSVCGPRDCTGEDESNARDAPRPCPRDPARWLAAPRPRGAPGSRCQACLVPGGGAGGHGALAWPSAGGLRNGGADGGGRGMVRRCLVPPPCDDLRSHARSASPGNEPHRSPGRGRRRERARWSARAYWGTCHDVIHGPEFVPRPPPRVRAGSPRRTGTAAGGCTGGRRPRRRPRR